MKNRTTECSDVRLKKVILHITESMGSGVEAVILDYASNTPEYEHHLLYTTRGFRTGQNVGNFASVSHVVGGKVQLWRSIKRRVSVVKPDIVHLHSSWAGLLGRAVLSNRPPAIVYSPHSFFFSRTDLSSSLSATARGIEALLSRRTDILGAVSPYEREQADVLGFYSVYIPHVIPDFDENQLDYAQAETSRATIAAVGRLCAQKDPNFLLLTKRAMERGGVFANWIWIGGGNKTMHNQLETNGVKVSGWVDRDLVYRLLTTAKVYVHTAAWEGAPVSLLEAEALGLPSVARSIPSVVSLGYREDLRSPDAVAEALIHIVEGRTNFSQSRIGNQSSKSQQQRALKKLYSEAIRMRGARVKSRGSE